MTVTQSHSLNIYSHDRIIHILLDVDTQYSRSSLEILHRYARIGATCVKTRTKCKQGFHNSKCVSRDLENPEATWAV